MTVPIDGAVPHESDTIDHEPDTFVTVAGRDAQSSCAGSLLVDLPPYCIHPPIEVVVFGWGVTEDGQLGLDSKQDVHKPSVIESLLGTQFSGFQFNRRPLVAGTRHTLAVTEDGRVLSWGWNDRGTLGLGHRRTTSKPAVIRGLEHEHVVQVAAGGWHCLAVTRDGAVYAWGGNEYFQCGIDAGHRDVIVPRATMPFIQVRMVSCGGMHSVALTTAGHVWQWGEPWGDFTMMEVDRKPRQLALQDVVSIASGAFHNLALTSAGQVMSWGTNDFGQLGTGSTTYAAEPSLVVGFDATRVADVSAGGWHSLALTSSGQVFTWGRGEYGRLGHNDPKGSSHLRPTLVPGLSSHKIIQASCGGSHTMVLSDSGRMFIWGRCSNGRQGFDVETTVEAPQELLLPGGAERWHPICVAAGGRHSLAMALPRQTVDDHVRRMTAMSEEMAWPDAGPPSRSASGRELERGGTPLGAGAVRPNGAAAWPTSGGGRQRVASVMRPEMPLSRSLGDSMSTFAAGGSVALGATVRVPPTDFLRPTGSDATASGPGGATTASGQTTPRASYPSALEAAPPASAAFGPGFPGDSDGGGTDFGANVASIFSGAGVTPRRRTSELSQSLAAQRAGAAHSSASASTAPQNVDATPHTATPALEDDQHGPLRPQTGGVEAGSLEFGALGCEQAPSTPRLAPGFVAASGRGNGSLAAQAGSTARESQAGPSVPEGRLATGADGPAPAQPPQPNRGDPAGVGGNATAVSAQADPSQGADWPPLGIRGTSEGEASVPHGEEDGNGTTTGGQGASALEPGRS